MKKESPNGMVLMRLVDRYKAMLEDIARYKLRAASLGGSAGDKERLRSELARKSREAEELERQINELRTKILAKEEEIKRLGGPNG
jgi:chromosome segregation ATPase